MATELKLPDMGEGIEDVTISAWRVAEGDTVSKGDIILEVATDKVDTEIPAPADGTVLKLHFGEGEIADLKAVLAVIGEPGEETAPATESGNEDASAQTAPDIGDVAKETSGAESTVSAPATNGAKASPVAIRVANDQSVDLGGVTGTGPGGRIIKADVLAAVGGKESGRASGLPGELADVASLTVTRVAAQAGMDLDEVAAGRPLSTLTRYDVMDAVAKRDGRSRSDQERYLAPSGWQQSRRYCAGVFTPAAAIDRKIGPGERAATRRCRQRCRR